MLFQLSERGLNQPVEPGEAVKGADGVWFAKACGFRVELGYFVCY